MRALWGLDHALEVTSKRMDARLGVTRPQRLVVRFIGQFPGISAGELARLQNVDKSNLTGILQRLEERGLLCRRKDPRDARRTLFWLTPRGLRLDAVRSGTVEAAVGHALAQVSPGALAGTHETLALLRANLEEEARRHRSGGDSATSHRAGRRPTPT
jgi:DNA-binding MarR family transcriptional regulator